MLSSIIVILLFHLQSLLEHQKNRKKPLQKHFQNSLVMPFSLVLLTCPVGPLCVGSCTSFLLFHCVLLLNIVSFGVMLKLYFAEIVLKQFHSKALFLGLELTRFLPYGS